MRPTSRAGYGAALMVGLTVALVVAHVVLATMGYKHDSVITLAIQGSVAATLGALVWVVHNDGGSR